MALLQHHLFDLAVLLLLFVLVALVPFEKWVPSDNSSWLYALFGKAGWWLIYSIFELFVVVPTLLYQLLAWVLSILWWDDDSWLAWLF